MESGVDVRLGSVRLQVKNVYESVQDFDINAVRGIPALAHGHTPFLIVVGDSRFTMRHRERNAIHQLEHLQRTRKHGTVDEASTKSRSISQRTKSGQMFIHIKPCSLTCRQRTAGGEN